MKLNKFFLFSAAVGLALASCSDDVAVTSPDNGQVAKGNTYVAVSVTQTQTRVSSEELTDKYAGSEAETKVDNIYFLKGGEAQVAFTNLLSSAATAENTAPDFWKKEDSGYTYWKTGVFETDATPTPVDMNVILNGNALTATAKASDIDPVVDMAAGTNNAGDVVKNTNLFMTNGFTMTSKTAKHAVAADVTKEEAVGDRTVVNVRLEEDANELDDVVVVAYGKQKKEHIVSSIQTVKSEDLYVPSSSLSTGFAGKLAGVIAVQRNGQPGADQADFWIRGISTFGSATDPLIILDGVSIDANELNGLDPEIIESFSVLKDATATALYGSRGANGVMIVTTKSGRDMEKPIVNFRVETALSMPTSRPETVDAVTYMQMFNEAALTRGTGEVLYTQEKIDGTRAGKDKYLYPDVDWYDEMFKQVAVNENVNFNIRGGGKRVDYFMSATVRHEEGMMRSLSEDYFSYNNNYSVWRYAFQNNVNVYLTNTTKVSLRLNTQLRNTHGPVKSSEDIFGMIMNGNPADMPVNSDGAANSWCPILWRRW